MSLLACCHEPATPTKKVLSSPLLHPSTPQLLVSHYGQIKLRFIKLRFDGPILKSSNISTDNNSCLSQYHSSIWNTTGYTGTQVRVPGHRLCPGVLVSRYTKFLFFGNFSGFTMNFRRFLADLAYFWRIFAEFRHLHRLFDDFWTFLSKKVVILRHLVYRYTCQKLNKKYPVSRLRALVYRCTPLCFNSLIN